MRFSSMPIALRVGLAVALPIFALCLTATLYTLDHFSSAKKMEQVQHVTDISRTVSILIHELQKERGKSAGYVGAKGKGEFPSLLKEQHELTDNALYSFESTIRGHLDALDDPYLDEVYEVLETDLSEVLVHRSGVIRLEYSLADTVGPYTSSISDLLEMVALSTHDASGSDLASDLTSLLALMNAKENAGIERAIGASTFAGGAITRDKYETAISLISRQKGFLDEFKMLMSDKWDEKLAAYEAKPEWNKVSRARQVLLDGLYTGDSNILAEYTGPKWFALTTDRIELLMSFETELVSYISDKANKLRSDFEKYANLSLWAAVFVVGITIIVSTFIILSVVRPIRKISVQLDQLASGRTDIKVSGLSRGDEIGMLSRAASAFLTASRERQAMMEEKANQEAISLEERREAMRVMAEEVKGATKKTVSLVSAAADTLMTNSREMCDQLSAAKGNASDVDQAAQATMESTEQAATLAGELNMAISEVAQNVVKGDEIARGAVELADTSRADVQELDEAAKQISDFVNIISELAEQTNLLALNATIESARAGEAGKGFSVVAEEIKQLANQTNRSASQISDRVGHIQSKTENAVASIGKITKAVQEIGGVTASVAAAVEEQRASTESFSNFLEENRKSLKGVAAGVGGLSQITIESAESALRIGGLAEDMAHQSKEVSETIPRIVESAVEAADRRRSERIEVVKPFEITDSSGKRPATILDISETGAHIEGELKGEDVSLTVAGLSSPFKAKVVWTNDGQAGVHFDTALSANELDNFIRLQNKSKAA